MKTNLNILSAKEYNVRNKVQIQNGTHLTIGAPSQRLLGLECGDQLLIATDEAKNLYIKKTKYTEDAFPLTKQGRNFSVNIERICYLLGYNQDGRTLVFTLSKAKDGFYKLTKKNE